MRKYNVIMWPMTLPNQFALSLGIDKQKLDMKCVSRKYDLKQAKFYHFFSWILIFVNRGFDMLSNMESLSFDIDSLLKDFPRIPAGIIDRLKIEAMYNNAVMLQASDIEEMRRDEHLTIPTDVDFDCKALNLSTEERQKLSAVQPQTVLTH